MEPTRPKKPYPTVKINYDLFVGSEVYMVAVFDGETVTYSGVLTKESGFYKIEDSPLFLESEIISISYL